MKKKFIVPIIISLLVLTVLLVVFLLPKKDSIFATFTLDINPSIEINVDEEEKVISVNPLNDDAKDLINYEVEGITVDEFLYKFTEKIVEKGYAVDNHLVILMNSTGNVDKINFEGKIINNFGEKDIDVELIIIESITEEDEKYAKEHNISSSKAAYINSISKENENIDKDLLINKPINELKDTKQTGNYCNDGYILEGDFCLKEISREKAVLGKICPRNYNEHDGKCYEEVGVLEKEEYICSNGFTLEGNECTRTITGTGEPIYYCEKGELKRGADIKLRTWKEEVACVDSTNGKAPTLRCMIGPHITINGKCYVGPAPTINGGCPGKDVLRNGGCYSLDPEDQWQCPDGSIYEKSKGTYVSICPDTLSYTKPKINGYTCNEGFSLQDNKCIRIEKEPARHERYCPSGYTLTKEDRCINYNNIKEFESGYRCDKENTRPQRDECVTYEIIEANHN